MKWRHAEANAESKILLSFPQWQISIFICTAYTLIPTTEDNTSQNNSNNNRIWTKVLPKKHKKATHRLIKHGRDNQQNISKEHKQITTATLFHKAQLFSEIKDHCAWPKITAFHDRKCYIIYKYDLVTKWAKKTLIYELERCKLLSQLWCLIIWVKLLNILTSMFIAQKGQ